MNKYSLEERRELKSRLKSVLMGHVGPSNKIGMGELYEQVFQEKYSNRINGTKMLRVLINELQNIERLRICSSQSRINGGYYLAQTGGDLNGYCDVLTHAALKKLKKVAVLRRVALPELLGQMRLNLTAEDGLNVQHSTSNIEL